MKAIQYFAASAALLLLISCSGPAASTENDTKKEEKSMIRTDQKVLFEDAMTENWQKNWFLDGKRATLEHRDGGLAFITTASKVDKRVDRAAFDAQHAVLWTRREFEGDIRISYTFTKLPGCSWQKLIYVQAQGVGTPPYEKDIHAWRELRDVARMDKYFNYMNLISLSLRNQIRCKRYPTRDTDGNGLKCEFLPRAENKGMSEGREYHCLVENRKQSILLRIKDVETGEHVVDHTWDLTDESVLKNREPKSVERGRIGIRQMGGHKILMRDFKVEQL